LKFKFQTVAAKKAKGGYFILPHLVDLLGMLYKFTIVILEMVYTSLKCAACLEITSLSRRRDIARLTPVHHNQGPPQPKMQFIPIPHPITNPIPEPTLTLSHVTKPTTGWEDAASSLSRPVCICQNFAKYWSIFRILSMALSGQLAIKLSSKISITHKTRRYITLQNIKFQNCTNRSTATAIWAEENVIMSDDPVLSQ